MMAISDSVSLMAAPSVIMFAATPFTFAPMSLPHTLLHPSQSTGAFSFKPTLFQLRALPRMFRLMMYRVSLPRSLLSQSSQRCSLVVALSGQNAQYSAMRQILLALGLVSLVYYCPCKSVSKQSTLTTFRINTCEKHREGGVCLLP